MGRMGRRFKREGIRGHMYAYGWFTLLYNRNWHSIVKQLYSNKDLFKKRKKTSLLTNNMNILRLCYCSGDEFFECLFICLVLFFLRSNTWLQFLTPSTHETTLMWFQRSGVPRCLAEANKIFSKKKIF